MIKLITPPFLLRKYYSDAIWNIPTNEKVVYLTFDDGPIPDVTEKVLDLLKLYNAKATFFCIGENVKKNQYIYQRILSENHRVGNHTLNHLKGIRTKNKEYFKNVIKCSQVVSSNLFRPPYGRLKKSQYNFLKQHYQFVFWDVLSWDFDKKTTPEKCAQNVIKNTKEGSVIVFHDSIKAKDNCLYALECTLKFFSKKGFRFQAIP